MRAVDFQHVEAGLQGATGTLRPRIDHLRDVRVRHLARRFIVRVVLDGAGGDEFPRFAVIDARHVAQRHAPLPRH